MSYFVLKLYERVLPKSWTKAAMESPLGLISATVILIESPSKTAMGRGCSGGGPIHARVLVGQ